MGGQGAGQGPRRGTGLYLVHCDPGHERELREVQGLALHEVPRGVAQRDLRVDVRDDLGLLLVPVVLLEVAAGVGPDLPLGVAEPARHVGDVGLVVDEGHGEPDGDGAREVVDVKLGAVLMGSGGSDVEKGRGKCYKYRPPKTAKMAENNKNTAPENGHKWQASGCWLLCTMELCMPRALKVTLRKLA